MFGRCSNNKNKKRRYDRTMRKIQKNVVVLIVVLYLLFMGSMTQVFGVPVIEETTKSEISDSVDDCSVCSNPKLIENSTIDFLKPEERYIYDVFRQLWDIDFIPGHSFLQIGEWDWDYLGYEIIVWGGDGDTPEEIATGFYKEMYSLDLIDPNDLEFMMFHSYGVLSASPNVEGIEGFALIIMPWTHPYSNEFGLIIPGLLSENDFVHMGLLKRQLRNNPLWYCDTFKKQGVTVCVEKPNHVPTTNGCGAPPINVPDKPFGIANFTSCCNAHDICYDRCNPTEIYRFNCDIAFLLCMLNECNQLSPAIRRAACRTLAANGYNVVRSRIGKYFFCRNQYTICDCSIRV